MKTKAILRESVQIPDDFTRLVTSYATKNMPLESAKSISKIEQQTKRLLSYLFTGTRGGTNRLRIMLLLSEKPLNMHQIAKRLGLDYNAIQFHIEVLEKNNLVSRAGEYYGTLFFLSSFLEHNIEAFNEIVARFVKS